MGRAASKSWALTPERHQTRTRSPNGSQVVSTMNGSRPLLVWIQACAHPLRIRCGVMKHHACAIAIRRLSGMAKMPIASTAAAAIVQIGPIADVVASTANVIATTPPISYRHRHARTSGFGLATELSAYSRLARACLVPRVRCSLIVIAPPARAACRRSPGRRPGNAGTAGRRRPWRRRSPGSGSAGRTSDRGRSGLARPA